MTIHSTSFIDSALFLLAGAVLLAGIIAHYTQRARWSDALHDAWHQARTDELTGLLNRRGLLRDLYRWSNSPRRWSLIMLDVDRFKTSTTSTGMPAATQS